MPISQCNATILSTGRDFFENGIDQSQYCAYNPESKQGTCGGDGAPLQIVSNDAKLAKVIGIVSSDSTCDTTLPNVYTRVAHYIDWIESQVWPNGEIAAPLVSIADTR